jgi:adenylate cyclase
MVTKKKNLEIERKFLVNQKLFDEMTKKKPVSIRQGYMSEDDKKLIRIRISDKTGFITIKGEGLLSHKEYEYKIPLEDAYEMLLNYCTNVINKKRYRVSYENHIWEIDQFFGDNIGLMIAEIELESENEEFKKPEWILEEVTGINRYYNNSLAKFPFKNWAGSEKSNLDLDKCVKFSDVIKEQLKDCVWIDHPITR